MIVEGQTLEVSDQIFNLGDLLCCEDVTDMAGMKGQSNNNLDKMRPIKCMRNTSNNFLRKFKTSCVTTQYTVDMSAKEMEILIYGYIAPRLYSQI